MEEILKKFLNRNPMSIYAPPSLPIEEAALCGGEVHYYENAIIAISLLINK